MSDLPDLLQQLQGAGQDTLDKSTVLPIVNLLQKASPEVDPTHPKYSLKCVKDARPGDIVYGGSVIKQPLDVAVLKFSTVYEEFRDRDEGGGRIAIYSPEEALKLPKYSKIGNDEYNGENSLIFTTYIAVLMPSLNNAFGIIKLKSTGLRMARKLQTYIANFRYEDEARKKMVPPTCARLYTLSSMIDNNAKGGWFAWIVNPGRVLDESKPEDRGILEACIHAYGEMDKRPMLPSPGHKVNALPGPVKEDNNEALDV